MTDATARVRSIKVTASAATAMEREVPLEVPVALVYDGTTYAVMMASPTNLEDFAVGFSLSEGIIEEPADIESLEVVEHAEGIELRMWLAKGRGIELATRRRQITGPTGCGLCGVESLEAAAAELPPVSGDVTFTAAEIMKAMASLAPAQELNVRTRAVHGAGFWNREQGLVADLIVATELDQAAAGGGDGGELQPAHRVGAAARSVRLDCPLLAEQAGIFRAHGHDRFPGKLRR